METSTSTPLHKTPAFWRGLAAEWRGPLTETTQRGICLQISLRHNYPIDDNAIGLLHTFEPSTSPGLYFFPLGDRASRAELCDHIANTLEKEQQNETSGIQTSTQTTS